MYKRTERLSGWLLAADKNYHEGVKLFAQFSKNANLIRIYSRSGPAKMNSLIYDMAKLIGWEHREQELYNIGKVKKKPKRIKARVQDSAREISADKTQIKFEPKAHDKERYDELMAVLKKGYKQRTLLRERLRNRDITTEERKLIAFEVLDLMNKIVKPAGREIDYYRAHGQWPKQEHEDKLKDMDQLELHKRLLTVRTYISKYKTAGNKKAHLLKKYEGEEKEILNQIENG